MNYTAPSVSMHQPSKSDVQDAVKALRAAKNPLEYRLRGHDKAEEQVVLDFELVPATGLAAAKGKVAKIRGYALYYACLDGPGECRYLRHDFHVEVPPAP